MTEKFDNKAIYLDTVPLIYYMEEASIGFSFLKAIFKRNENGDFTFFTSSRTLAEVLTLPFKMGKAKLTEQYEYFITQSSFPKLIKVNLSIAKLAPRLRSEHRLKLPGAIHLATALEVKLDNDLSLKSTRSICNYTN